MVVFGMAEKRLEDHAPNLRPIEDLYTQQVIVISSNADEEYYLEGIFQKDGVGREDAFSLTIDEVINYEKLGCSLIFFSEISDIKIPKLGDKLLFKNIYFEISNIEKSNISLGKTTFYEMLIS